MAGAGILTLKDQAALAQAPRKGDYLTPEQRAFDNERRRVSRQNAWMAIPALAPAAAVAAAGGVPIATGLVRGFASRARVKQAARAIEDVFGDGRVLERTEKKFRAQTPDGRTQLRMDLDGHGYKPHFHLERVAPKGPPSDLLDQHMFFFRKTP